MLRPRRIIDFHHRRQVPRCNTADRERLHQFAPCLTIGTFETSLRTTRERRRPRRIVAAALPPALLCDGALVASRRSCDTQRRTEIHDHLIPVSCETRRQHFVGEHLRLARFQRTSLDTGNYARNVCVDDGRIVTESKCQNCAGGVRSDARQGHQCVEVARHFAAVVLDNHLCRFLNVAATTGITHSLPFDEQVRERTFSTSGWRRRKCNEAFEAPVNTPYVGLLQHDLGDKDMPRVARCAPRKIPLTWQTPRQ